MSSNATFGSYNINSHPQAVLLAYAVCIEMVKAEQ